MSKKQLVKRVTEMGGELSRLEAKLNTLSGRLEPRVEALNDRCEKIEFTERERYERILDYLGVEEEEYAELEVKDKTILYLGEEPPKKAIKKTKLVKKEKTLKEELVDVDSLYWVNTKTGKQVRKRKKARYSAWTKDEVKFLRENRHTMTRKKLARELGRSVPCINAKIYRLN